MSRYYRSILNVQGGAIDPDAQAFLMAAGIVDATITSAINNLVVGLKGASLWTKMKAIYPFVGGTATTHKFNLKDPRDLDVAFRLTFFGGITHSANGVQGNGTNGYANTHLSNTAFTLNSFFGGGYSRTNYSGLDTIFGAISGANNGVQVTPSFEGNFATRCQSIGPGSTANADTTGFLAINRTNGTNYGNIIRTTTANQAVASNTPENFAISLFALNSNGTNVLYARQQMASYYFGDGLTSGEIASLRGLDLTFQTALSRNI